MASFTKEMFEYSPKLSVTTVVDGFTFFFWNLSIMLYRCRSIPYICDFVFGGNWV